MPRPPLTLLVRGPGYAVVAKPPLMLVHRSGFSGPDRDVLLQRLRDQLGAHVHPIHRLDRPASGAVLFAVDDPPELPDAEVPGAEVPGSEVPDAAALQASLSAGDKRYLALVRGAMRVADTSERIVETPMNDERGVLQEARSAVRVLAWVDEPRCSLVEVRPFTGRYHQVRRHLRDLGHPILGDGEHGDYRVNRQWQARGLSRLALHAASLSLSLWPTPVVCPLFADMHRLIQELPWSHPPVHPALTHTPLSA